MLTPDWDRWTARRGGKGGILDGKWNVVSAVFGVTASDGVLCPLDYMRMVIAGLVLYCTIQQC